MNQITVIFDESLHHTCLMYGLKQTFGRMPFLNRRVHKIGGKTVTMDNIVSTPPMMRNPERKQRQRKIRNMVEVSYWKNTISVCYMKDMCRKEEITAFAQNLVEDYLHFRHPFLETEVSEKKIVEKSSGHRIAEILQA